MDCPTGGPVGWSGSPRPRSATAWIYCSPGSPRSGTASPTGRSLPLLRTCASALGRWPEPARRSWLTGWRPGCNDPVDGPTRRSGTTPEVVPVPVEVEVAVPASDLPCGRCRASAKTLDQKGTAVPKDTQPTTRTDHAKLQLPEQVSVAVAELAGAAREGLLALAVGTGLQVLQAMLAEDVARLVGPKGRHIPDRTAVRHGSEPGQVTLGGRRVRMRRPRVRTADGRRELPVPTYQAVAATELLGQLALERMLAKLSTRRYPAGLEPVGIGVEQAATGTSKSAVSRRFVARTEHALAELLAQDLTGLDLVALLVDGIR